MDEAAFPAGAAGCEGVDRNSEVSAGKMSLFFVSVAQILGGGPLISYLKCTGQGVAFLPGFLVLRISLYMTCAMKLPMASAA